MHILSDKKFDQLTTCASIAKAAAQLQSDKVIVLEAGVIVLRAAASRYLANNENLSSLNEAHDIALKYTVPIVEQLKAKNTQLANAITVHLCIAESYEKTLSARDKEIKALKAEVEELNGLLTPVTTKVNFAPVNKELERFAIPQRAPVLDLRPKKFVAVIGTTAQCDAHIKASRPSEMWYVVITSIQDAKSESIKGVVFEKVFEAYPKWQKTGFEKVLSEIQKRTK